MKFENKGKWIKEAEDKLAAYDTQEHPDFLDGDNKVCTFEDDEVANFEEDDLDIVEEDDTLDSPEEEEMDLAMEAAMPPMGQRKRIEFEDDIVKVYDGNKEIYAGTEDYEPMQDEDWKWDNANKYYKFDKYIKVCCESSQKNETSKKTFSVRRLDSRTIKLKDNAGKLYLMQLTDFGPSNLEADIEDYVKDKLHGKLLNLDYDHDTGRGTMDVMIESSQKNEDKKVSFKDVKLGKIYYVDYALQPGSLHHYSKSAQEQLKKLNVVKNDGTIVLPPGTKLKVTKLKNSHGFTEVTIPNTNITIQLNLDVIADELNSFYSVESAQKNEATMSDIKAKLKGAKEVPIGHYKRGNEQTIVANDSKGEHRLIISDTGYARLIERLDAHGRGEKVIEKVYKLN